MDITTIAGLLISICSLIFAFILEGGSIGLLLGLSAAIIVFGGTIGATIISFPLRDILKIPSLLITAFKNQPEDYDDIITYIVALAQKARSDGLLSLEAEITSDNMKKYDPLMAETIEMIVDGINPNLVKDTMENRIYILEKEDKKNASIFEAAGGYAPTMGIIGTVMGLVHVLGNLSDPESLGPSIAVAFIATLYGVSSANLLWLPIAQKLKSKYDDQKLAREMILEGCLSIQEGENPKFIERKLRTFLINENAKAAESSEGVANEKS